MATTEQDRIINTTIHKYIRQEEDAIMRNQKLLAMLKSRGRIMFNSSGDMLDWKIRYKRAPGMGFADGDVFTFAQQSRWRTAQVDWRGYIAGDQISEFTRLKNKGTEAIIKIWDGIVPALVEDLEEYLGTEMYKDGYAAANLKGLHGIESFMGDSGPATNGFICTPSDNYAGLETGLGANGGTWEESGGATAWPSGVGSSEYDFWSPLIVDYTDTVWGSPTKTWENTCEEALRYGIIKGRRNSSKRGKMDWVDLDNTMYLQLLNYMSGKEKIVTQRNDPAKPGLTALGFGDVFNFEGTEITYEWGIPTAVGYGWCMDYVAMECLADKLLVPKGPDYNINEDNYRFACHFYGNLRFQQLRHFTKWKAGT